ncbi:PID-CTERM protein-sorting domain-containing protein [Pedobacter xixiisoli]|uniref:Uncharacterized protein n=1 Tax=Pedobacter xixiisoli TaxID=1476464 RepID=A0A286A7U2_9SPHI|nr:hypothetical protein [Pedobacter xixiisoli]SOD17959.1 hypothetical protein SAMN06297358_2755 [Pedobacter xixiisoli]
MTGPITRKTFYRALTFVFFGIVCSPFVSAQPLPPCEDGSIPEPGADCVDTPAPIDGGASILIAAGVAYGLKRAYDKRKQNKEADIA